MSNTIGQLGAIADLRSAGAAQSIGIALQAEVQSAQIADVQALFGSLGLGANADAAA